MRLLFQQSIYCRTADAFPSFDPRVGRELSENNLDRSIPSELGQLTGLTYL